MNVEKLDNGLIIFEPTIFKDDRGYFFESYNENIYSQYLLRVNWVQDNESKSVKGVLRGLHFQKPPFAQAKLVRVVSRRVMDYAVDLRKDSPTYGKWYSVELTEDNHKQFYIPRGFAHGFEVLSDEAVFQYKCDNQYNKDSEGGLQWNDPDIAIPWKTETLILSEKDKVRDSFKNFVTPF